MVDWDTFISSAMPPLTPGEPVPCYDCTRRPAKRAPHGQPSRCLECALVQQQFAAHVRR